MGNNNDSRGILYVGIGALAAVGAGYLVWRYALTEETKTRVKQTLRTAAKNASELATEYGSQAVNLAAEAATNGRAVAGKAKHAAADALESTRSTVRPAIDRLRQ